MVLAIAANLTLFVGALAEIYLFMVFATYLVVWGLDDAARFVPAMAAALLMCAGAMEIEFHRRWSAPLMVLGWALFAVGLTIAAG
jgi:hypothetical protein